MRDDLPRYTFGDTPLAARRLELLSDAFEASTRAFLAETAPPAPRLALDLGCGPGNTANELNETSYISYLGVDISEKALAKAVRRTEESGRAGKNRFTTGDFLTYRPAASFDVILFRESMYHVPIGMIKAVLERYVRHLSQHGVFIVRMGLTGKNGEPLRRPTKMVRVIEAAFNVVERVHDAKTGGGVIVFQPKTRKAAEA